MGEPDETHEDTPPMEHLDTLLGDDRQERHSSWQRTDERVPAEEKRSSFFERAAGRLVSSIPTGSFDSLQFLLAWSKLNLTGKPRPLS